MTDQLDFPWDDYYDEDDDARAEQEDHLDRISSRIEWAIIDYLSEHEAFHADDLRKYVVAVTGVAAPASSDRILRHLRQRGVIDYIVLSRRESLYKVLRVPKREAK